MKWEKSERKKIENKRKWEKMRENERKRERAQREKERKKKGKGYIGRNVQNLKK